MAMMQLIQKAEVFLADDDCPEFKYTSAVYCDGDSYFFAFMNRRLSDIPDELAKSDDLDGYKVSSATLYPIVDKMSFTKAQCPPSSACFIKKPRLVSSEPSFDDTKELLLQEAHVLEVLKRYPHPNIMEYHGYISHGRQLRGFCSKMYTESLSERIDRLGPKFDVDQCLTGIRKGLNFLHEMGYAHNDINPSNIMMKTDGEPVIIDFDSCVRIGGKLGAKAGTPLFSDEEATHSRAENDFYSYDLLKKFIEVQLREKQNAPLIA